MTRMRMGSCFVKYMELRDEGDERGKEVEQGRRQRGGEHQQADHGGQHGHHRDERDPRAQAMPRQVPRLDNRVKFPEAFLERLPQEGVREGLAEPGEGPHVCARPGIRVTDGKGQRVHPRREVDVGARAEAGLIHKGAGGAQQILREGDGAGDQHLHGGNHVAHETRGDHGEAGGRHPECVPQDEPRVGEEEHGGQEPHPQSAPHRGDDQVEEDEDHGGHEEVLVVPGARDDGGQVALHGRLQDPLQGPLAIVCEEGDEMGGTDGQGVHDPVEDP